MSASHDVPQQNLHDRNLSLPLESQFLRRRPPRIPRMEGTGSSRSPVRVRPGPRAAPKIREMTAAPSPPAELDPQAGGLIEDARARAPERLGERDSRAALFGAAGLPRASPSPSRFLAPSDRGRPRRACFVLLVLAYALAARVEFEVGPGFAVPTEIVFVPMLFLLPVGVVPLCVALGFVLCASVDLVRGKVHGERALLEVFSAWHALGPAAVLALAGEPDTDAGRCCPLLGARAHAAVRARLRQLGRPRPLRLRRPGARAAPRDRARLPRRRGARAGRLPLRGGRLRPAVRRSCSSCRSSGCSRSSRRSGRAASTMRWSSGTPTAARRSSSAT